jgi:Mg-chelatase subunit ChlD/Tfp pilus assembly protein PilE
MTPDLPKNPRDELESKLTALLLGELPSDEAFALGRALEQDPELAKLYKRLEQTIHLVRETEAPQPAYLTSSAPLKLSNNRREALLQQFKTVKPKEFEKPGRVKFGLLEIAAIVAIIAILSVIALPSLSGFKSESNLSKLSFNRDASEKSLAPTLDPAIQRPNDPQVATLSRGLHDGADYAAPASVFDTTKALKPQEDKKSVGATTYFGNTDSELASKDTKPKSQAAPIVLPPAETAPPAALAFKTWGMSTTAGESDVNGRAVDKSGANAFAFGDPDWIATPERPTEASKSGHIASNAFIGRYAFSVVPGTALDVETTKNYADLNRNSRLEVMQADRQSGDSLYLGTQLSAGNRGTVAIGGGAGTAGAPGLKVNPTPQFAPTTGLPMSLSDVPGQSLTNARAGELAFDDLAQASHESLATKQESKVPLLGEIPVGGRLFRSDSPNAPAPTPLQTYSATVSGVTVSTNMTLPDQVNLAIVDDFSAGKLLNKGIPAKQPEIDRARLPGIQSEINVALNEAVRRQPIILPPPSNEVTLTFNAGTAAAGAANKANGQTFYRNLSQLGADSSADTGKVHLDGETFGDSLVKKSKAQSGSAETLTRAVAGPSNVYDSNIVGYVEAKQFPAEKPIGTADPQAANPTRSQQEGKPVLTGITTFSGTKTGQLEIAVHQKEVDGLREKSGVSGAVAVADAARASRPYFEARRKLDEMQRFNQSLAGKIELENLELGQPKSPTVEIVDAARPASHSSATFWDKVRGKPATFESKARIKTERDGMDIASSDARTADTLYDPYFIQTEFETIQSDRVLGRVVKDLNLDQKWAKGGRAGGGLSTNEAIAKLKTMLDLKPVKNTSNIEIGAKSDKPSEAAEIANAVARAYADYRQEARRKLTIGGISALKEQLVQQRQEIASAEAEVDRLKPQAPPPQEDKPVAKPTAPAPIPQPEVQAVENPFSTFSLNVSDVSFKLAAASLEQGILPEPASIRSEEFINAFDYRDPEPSPGVSVAFASERAGYPFAQNRGLLRFSIKTAALGREPGRPMNLVVLLDNSGSMERADRVRIIHEALRLLASQLKPQDKLSIVTFSRTARLVVDGIAGDQAAAQVADEVSGLTPQGGTNLEEAMNLAYQTALRHYLANGINRVVLLTDGAANLGDVKPESLKQKVEANRKQGIALDCFGIGWEGYNDDLLEVLSRNGDGRYGFINSPEAAASEFAGQLAGALHVAASDVKVQVEFNPKRVQAYRQIGYAKHQLTKEQFRDNTVDAAEIGAAESGNALYVIEVNPQGEGPLATVRCRYKVPGTSDYREQEWTVPYTSNAVALDQSTPAMRLAATASAFSEWLAASPYAAEVTTDRLLGYLSGVPEIYGADARPKKLEWMIRQAKSLGNK